MYLWYLHLCRHLRGLILYFFHYEKSAVIFFNFQGEKNKRQNVFLFWGGGCWQPAVSCAQNANQTKKQSLNKLCGWSCSDYSVDSPPLQPEPSDLRGRRAAATLTGKRDLWVPATSVYSSGSLVPNPSRRRVFRGARRHDEWGFSVQLFLTISTARESNSFSFWLIKILNVLKMLKC